MKLQVIFCDVIVYLFVQLTIMQSHIGMPESKAFKIILNI